MSRWTVRVCQPNRVWDLSSRDLVGWRDIEMQPLRSWTVLWCAKFILHGVFNGAVHPVFGNGRLSDVCSRDVCQLCPNKLHRLPVRKFFE